MIKQNYSPDNTLPSSVEYFKEEALSELLVIPCEKPDIEEVLDILVWPEVVDYKIIKTEKGMSNSGQSLSGYKLIVKLKIKEKVIYVADVCQQSVHAAHYELEKNMFIVMPESIDKEDICKLVHAGKIQIIPYVESVDFKKINNRCIQKCVMLLVEAKKIG